MLRFGPDKQRAVDRVTPGKQSGLAQLEKLVIAKSRPVVERWCKEGVEGYRGHHGSIGLEHVESSEIPASACVFFRQGSDCRSSSRGRAGDSTYHGGTGKPEGPNGANNPAYRYRYMNTEKKLSMRAPRPTHDWAALFENVAYKIDNFYVGVITCETGGGRGAGYIEVRQNLYRQPPKKNEPYERVPLHSHYITMI